MKTIVKIPVIRRDTKIFNSSQDRLFDVRDFTSPVRELGRERSFTVKESDSSIVEYRTSVLDISDISNLSEMFVKLSVSTVDGRSSDELMVFVIDRINGVITPVGDDRCSFFYGEEGGFGPIEYVVNHTLSELLYLVKPVGNYDELLVFLTQTGTGNPRMTILSDGNLDSLGFVRNGVGDYAADLGSLIDHSLIDIERDFKVQSPSYASNKGYNFDLFDSGGTTWVSVKTFVNSTGVAADSVLDNTRLWLRIYH